MLKITYTFGTNMDITLDEEFTVHYGNGCIEMAVAKARWAFGEYGFTHADIIDHETGELLAVMDAD